MPERPSLAIGTSHEGRRGKTRLPSRGSRWHLVFPAGFAAATMVCIVESVFEQGEWAIPERKDPTGLHGCGFLRIVGGTIVFQRGYRDKLTSLRLQGLPLPRE